VSVTVNQLEKQALGITRDFLISILAAGTEVVWGQDNRVPEPTSDNFVVMTPTLRTQLETTLTLYSPATGNSTRTDVQPTRFTLQLDFHGTSAGDNAQVFTTLYRSSYACSFYEQDTTFPVDITPLYQSDPRQLPFINGEGQYEERWTIDAEMQVNPVITTIAQSATVATTGIIDVDATYKP
jgi:hypothetical protein